MKKTLAIATLLAGAVGAYAQGQLNFADYGGAVNSTFAITIWSPVTGAAPGAGEVQGNSAANANPASNTPDVPAGTTAYPGATALGGSATGSGPTAYGNGNLWSVELYANGGSGALAPVSGSVSPFYTDSSVIGNPGEWNASASVSGTSIITFGGASGTAGAPTAAPLSSVTVAVAAWYNGGGSITSYASALTQSPVVPAGMSSSGTVALTGAPNPPAVLPGGPSGIQSFSLNAAGSGTVSPEPSTIALGVMGASAFLMRLRRK